jgi:hypothetical protein
VKILSSLAAIALGSGLWSVSSAYDLTPTASMSALFTDNAARTATDRMDDVVIDTTPGVLLRAYSPDAFADIKASDTFRYYADHTFPSTQLPYMVATAGWMMVPGTLTWDVEDELGQIATSPMLALDPGDRQNINLLTIGPRFILALAPKTDLNIEAHASDSYYSRSNIDNWLLKGAAGLQYTFSPLHKVSLNYDQERTYFKYSDLYQGFTEQNAYLRLDSALRLVSWRVDLGESGFQSASARAWRPLLGVTLYSLIGHYTTVGADFRRDVSNAGESFRAAELNPVFSAGDTNVLSVAAPFVETTYSAFVSSERPRSSARLYVYYTTDNYEQLSAFNRVVFGSNLSASVNLTPRNRITGDFFYERDTDADGSDRLKGFGGAVQISRAITRSLRVALGVARYQERSGLDESSYFENRVALYIYYEPPLRSYQLQTPYGSRGMQLPSALSGGRSIPGAPPPATPVNSP